MDYVRALAIGLALLVTGTQAQAAKITIDACNLDIGTDVSTAVPGATVSWADYSVQPATVDPALVVGGWHTETESDFCGKAIGGSTSLGEFRPPPPESTGIYGSGIRIDFGSSIRGVELQGWGSAGDTLHYYLYNANDELLVWNDILQSDELPSGWNGTYFNGAFACSDYGLAWCHYYEWGLRLPASSPIQYMIIGSHDAPILFDKIIFTVPEPGTVALLGLGLVGLAFARRRKLS